MENKEIVKELEKRLGAILLKDTYTLEIYKLGLQDGWEACDNRFAACSTGEFEAPTLEEILEQVDNELKRHI